MPTFENDKPLRPDNPSPTPVSPKAHKAHKDHLHPDVRQKKGEGSEPASKNPDEYEGVVTQSSEVTKVQEEGNAAIADLRDSMHPDDGDMTEDEKKAAELEHGYKQRLSEMQGKKDALEDGQDPRQMTNPTNITSPASHLTGGEPQPVDEGEP